METKGRYDVFFVVHTQYRRYKKVFYLCYLKPNIIKNYPNIFNRPKMLKGLFRYLFILNDRKNIIDLFPKSFLTDEFLIYACSIDHNLFNELKIKNNSLVKKIIYENPLNARFVKKIDDDFCIELINKYDDALKWIKNPSNRVLNYGIDKDVKNIIYADKPRQKDIIEAITKYPDLLIRAYKQQKSIINYSVKKHPMTILYVKSPYKLIKDYVLDRDPSILLFHQKIDFKTIFSVYYRLMKLGEVDNLKITKKYNPDINCLLFEFYLQFMKKQDGFQNEEPFFFFNSKSAPFIKRLLIPKSLIRKNIEKLGKIIREDFNNQLKTFLK